jgi:hypothetical protein
MEHDSQSEDEYSSLPLCPLTKLRNSMAPKFLTSPFEAKPFLPQSSFSKLITPDRIRECLPDNSPVELLNWVSESAPKLFAIIVSLKVSQMVLGQHMNSFKKRGFNDKLLPVPKLDLKLCKTRECSHKKAFNIFHNSSLWDEAEFIDLREKQWKFLSPVFTNDRNKFVHELDTEHVWPITWLGEVSDRGHFGLVRKATLCFDHLKILPSVSLIPQKSSVILEK